MTWLDSKREQTVCGNLAKGLEEWFCRLFLGDHSEYCRWHKCSVSISHSCYLLLLSCTVCFFLNSLFTVAVTVVLTKLLIPFLGCLGCYTRCFMCIVLFTSQSPQRCTPWVRKRRAWGHTALRLKLFASLRGRGSSLSHCLVSLPGTLIWILSTHLFELFLKVYYSTFFSVSL